MNEAPRRRRPYVWLRRRWRRVLAGMLVLAILARLALPIALPVVLARVGAARELELSYERLDLSLLSGRLELWRFDARPSVTSEEPPAEALARLEYLALDLDVWALFTGKLRIDRAQLDGLDLFLARDAAGHWNFEPHLPPVPEQEPAPATTESVETRGEVEPLSFDLPLEVRFARLQHVRVHLDDRAVEPPISGAVEVFVRLSDLGSEQRSARMEVLAHAPGILDSLTVEGRGASGGLELDAQLALKVAGFHPRPLSGWLAPMGLCADADRLAFAAELDLQAEPNEVEATADEEAQDVSARARADHHDVSARGRADHHKVSARARADHHKVSARARASLGGLTLRADGAEALALDSVAIDVARLARGELAVESILARGLRAAGGRAADGTIGFAGLALVGGGHGQASESAPAGLDGGSVPARVSIARAAIEGASIAFHDAAVEPAGVIELALEELSVENVVFGTEPVQPVAVRAHLAAPGLARAVTAEGTATLFAPQRALDLTLAIEGLKPERAAPYLRAAGLESTLSDGGIKARLTASQRAADGIDALACRLSEVFCADSGRELAQLEGLDVELVLGPEPDAVRVQRAAFEGLRTELTRDAEGRVGLLGLRTLAPAGADHGFQPVQLELARLDASLEGLTLGVEGAEPARLRVRAVATDLARELGIDGQLIGKTKPLGVRAELALIGRGLSYGALAPLLAERGIEARLADGELDARLAAGCERRDDGWSGSLRFSDLRFADAQQTFLALDELHVPEWVAGPGGTAIERVDLIGAELGARRDASGALLVAGLRIQPGGGEAAGRRQPAPAAQPEVVEPAPREGASTARVALGSVHADFLRVLWSDDAVEPAVATELGLSLDLSDLLLGAPGPPAAFDARIALAGALDELSLTGRAGLDPDQASLELALRARGLRAGTLAGYVPPGIEVLLADGRLALDLSASTGAAQAGGRRAALELTDMELRDGEAGAALLSLERMVLDLERHDPEAGFTRIGEISLAGLELEARRTGAARYELLGLAFESDPAHQQDAAPAPDPQTPVPTSDAVEAAAPRTSAVSRIELGRFDLELARFGFLDSTAPASQRLELQLGLSAPPDVVLLDGESGPPQPLELTLTGSAAPILGVLEAHATLEPFASDPRASIALDLRGLRGDGLTEVWPALAGAIDGSGLADGRLSARAELLMRVRKRGPLDFDLSSGFGVELDAGPIEVRDGFDGPLLAGVESLAVDVRKIRPAGGDVHVATIEIERPSGRVSKEPEGLRVLGLLLRAPAADARAAAPAEPPAEEAARITALAERAAPAPELRIDRLELSGLDFEYADRTVEPPLLVPLTDAEIELTRFTTRALVEALPVQFRLALYAGEVALPERTSADSLLAGVLGAAASALGGGGDAFETEQRPLFDQLELSGRGVLYPLPKGWVRLQLGGLELPALRGAAAAAGVSIGDGLVDSDLRLRFRGEQGLSIDSGTTFDYLSLSEPAGGPISSWLKLPAPLDTVLFVLRNEQGEQKIPLNLRVGSGGLSPIEVSRAVATTLGQLIADALSASPFRIVGGVLDLTGLGFGEPVELSPDSIAVDFEPGESAFGSAAWDGLRPLIEAMRKDESIRIVVQHELGPGDVARAERLANPSAAECLQLAQRLRATKREVLGARDELASDARASWAVGRDQEAQVAAERLRALELELEQTETALDNVLALIRPGAERRRDKRTRAACLTLAAARLAAARRELLSAGVPRMAQRIDVRRARFALPDAAEGSPGGGRVTLTPKRRE